jgi:hypothetical protein
MSHHFYRLIIIVKNLKGRLAFIVHVRNFGFSRILELKDFVMMCPMILKKYEKYWVQIRFDLTMSFGLCDDLLHFGSPLFSFSVLSDLL